MRLGRMFIDEDAWEQLSDGVLLESPGGVRLAAAFRVLWCFSVEFCRIANKG